MKIFRVVIAPVAAKPHEFISTKAIPMDDVYTPLDQL